MQADGEAQKFQEFEAGVQVPNRAVPKCLTWAGNRVALLERRGFDVTGCFSSVRASDIGGFFYNAL